MLITTKHYSFALFEIYIPLYLTFYILVSQWLITLSYIKSHFRTFSSSHLRLFQLWITLH